MASLSFSGVKGRSLTTPLERVTLFCGENDSGKTAAMEALRLSLLCNGEIGSSNPVIGELALDKAEAMAILDDTIGQWRLEKKKGKVSVSQSVLHNGIQVTPEAITAEIPVTSSEFWALSGEQKMSVIQSVLGRFDEPEPPDFVSLQQEVKDLESWLESSTKIEPYTGPPASELKSQCNALEAWLNEQEADRKFVRHTQATLEQDKVTISETDEAVAKLSKDMIHLLKDTDTDFANGERLIKEIDAAGFSSGANLDSNISDACASSVCAIESSLEKFRAASKVLTDPEIPTMLDEIADKLMLLHQQVLSDHRSLAEAILSPSSLALWQQYKANGCTTVADILDSVDARNAKANITQRQIDSYLSDRTLIASRLEKLEAKLKHLASEATVGRESLKLEGLRLQLATSEEVSRTLGLLAENTKLLGDKTADLAKRKKDKADWMSRRADYMQQFDASICSIANTIITECGLPKAIMSFSAVGKRPVLSISAEGTSLKAMSGSQQVIYGAAILHAIQMLSKSVCPIMFIRAAELSSTRLALFVKAMVTARTRGFVFIEHWSKVPGCKIVEV